ncbi:MAG: ABC transporter substrate-binding protein [Thermodesulfobacteriota bacterium]
MRLFFYCYLVVMSVVGLSFRPAFGQEPYKIGAVLSTTGPAAFMGEPQKNSLLMIQQEINSRGGIDGHPLQMIIYDDASNRDQAIKAVNRLIEQDRVVAIIGPSLSSSTLAAIPLVEEGKVPLISCAAAVEIVRPVKPWVFKTPPSDALAVERILTFLKSRQLSKLGLIYDQDAFGTAGRDRFFEQSSSRDIELVAKERYDAKEIDMREQIRKVVAKGAQAIVVWGTGPAPVVIARDMKDMGVDLPLINSHGVIPSELVELGREAVNGSYLPVLSFFATELLSDRDPQKKLINKYRADYQKRYGRAQIFGSYAWDAAWMVIDALKNVGADRKKIRDYLENLKNVLGISGVYNISAQDHNGLSRNAFMMVQIDGNRVKLVD